MSTFEKFKRALIVMKDTGELEKILNATKGKDRKIVERDIQIIDQLVELGADKVSAIPIIYELKSVDIFKNALCYMLQYDKEA